MKSRYHSFLVRLWSSESDEDAAWHISLESSETGEKQIFANLNALFQFLENLTGAPSVLKEDTEGESSI